MSTLHQTDDASSRPRGAPRCSDVDASRTDTSVVEGPQGDGGTAARLLIEESGRPPRMLVLPVGAEVRVGRSAEVEVTPDDRRSSRVHAVIRFDGRQVTVRDGGSSNGTFVGARRVSETTPVEAGAIIHVGSSRLVVMVSQRSAWRAGDSAKTCTSDSMA